MLKIGIECENLEDAKSRWGVGQLVLNLLEEYAKDPELQKNFKLYLYFNKRIPDDEVLKNPIFIKRIARVPSFNIFYHIAMPIRAIMDRLDWMFFPAYMLPPLYFRRSIVQLTNDVYYEYKYGSLPFKYRLAYFLFTNWAAIKAKKIMAMSEASKKEIARLYKVRPDRICVNHLGVSNPKPEIDSNLYSNLGIKDSNFILYIGQMFPRRHAKETIEAFMKVSPDFPGLKLILIGKDKYPFPIIDKLIEEKNRELKEKRIIHYDYLKDRKDIEKLYKNAKLFIYVSDYEAFGLPPVEAASYGIPVVVKNNELNHEIFGNAAFFTDNDIADTIRKGLSDGDKRDYCIRQYKEIIPKLSWRNFTVRFFENLK